MMIRLTIALALAALLSACDETPTPTPPPALTVRIALPIAVQWQRAGVERPSLAAYPEPTEAPAETAYP